MSECGCGMCGGGNHYSIFMMGGFGFGYSEPWYAGRREKSGAAEDRERIITNRFNSIKRKVEDTLAEKTKVRTEEKFGFCFTQCGDYVCIYHFILGDCEAWMSSQIPKPFEVSSWYLARGYLSVCGAAQCPVESRDCSSSCFRSLC